MAHMHKNRIDALIDKFQENHIGALLVTKPENIFYLTSFVADKIFLIIDPKSNIVITDFIYAEAASRFFHNFEVCVTKGKDTFVKTITAVLDKHKIKNLGFESLALNFSHYKQLKRVLKGRNVVATVNMIESLREIKEKNEILALSKALKVTAETFKNIKKRLRPDVTELAVSKNIKELFIKNGADGYSFEPIVATQPSSSQPHYTPGKKKLGSNKAILVDMGAKLAGYNSDLTRMCALGKISTKFTKLYAILCDAQKRAIECIKPGAKISDIDLAARQHIDSKGLRKFFGHDLGHGIGLEIHERPSISNSSKDVLKEGMVFTVEPGIYIPGYGGLRIEETIRVSRTGCEVLTDDINKSI